MLPFRQLSFGCFVLALAAGCGSTTPTAPDARASKAPRTPRVEGLVRIESDLPGVLLVKPDHHMASYDWLMVDPIILTYESRRDRLSARDTEELKAYLREATARELVNVALEKIVEEPGPCVLRMQTSFVDLDLPELSSDVGSNVAVIQSHGQVTLVHEMQDSETGTVLLRYVGRRAAPGGSLSGSHASWRHMRRTFDRMLRELQKELVAAVPHSRAKTGPLAACGGQIYQTIEEARPELTESLER